MSEWRHVDLTDKEAAAIITAKRNGGFVGVVPSVSPETHMILEGLKAKGIFTISKEYPVMAGTTLYPSQKTVTEDTVGKVYKMVNQLELIQSEEH